MSYTYLMLICRDRNFRKNTTDLRDNQNNLYTLEQLGKDGYLLCAINDDVWFFSKLTHM